MIKWIKRLFRKADFNKMDVMLSKLDLLNFYGAPSEEIHYFDVVLQTSIFTIKAGRVPKIYLTKLRREYLLNIGLNDLTRLERIYIYNKIEEFMVLENDKIEFKLKQGLLSHLGLSESQFAFLAENCKIN